MLRNYIIIGWRVLVRRKFFTFVSLFGIGITLTVLILAAALLDHLFGAHPPEVHVNRILIVDRFEVSGPGGLSSGPPGYGALNRYARDLPYTEAVAIFSIGGLVNSFHGGFKTSNYLRRVDGNYWEVLDFDFIEGMPFTQHDNDNANFVAVINRATRTEFFGTESVIGEAIEVDGQRFKIVGVVENVSQLHEISYADVWVPITTSKTSSYRHEMVGSFGAIVLARRPEDRKAIGAELNSRLAAASLPDPRIYDRIRGRALTLTEMRTRRALLVSEPGLDEESNLLGLLLGRASILALVFMVLPAINLANLNMSRLAERSSEISVRKAFGASSGTLAVQFLIENLLLTLIGAFLSLGASVLVLEAFNHSGIVPHADLRLSLAVFTSGLLFAVLFGILSGVLPAWWMSRVNPAVGLSGRHR